MPPWFLCEFRALLLQAVSVSLSNGISLFSWPDLLIRLLARLLSTDCSKIPSADSAYKIIKTTKELKGLNFLNLEDFAFHTVYVKSIKE